MADNKLFLMKEKLSALSNEGDHNAFLQIFIEMSNILNSYVEFDTRNYLEMIDAFRDRIDYIPNEILLKLLDVIYINMIQHHDPTLIIRSMFLLTNCADPGDSVKFFNDIYDNSPRSQWVLPLAMSYIDWDKMNEDDSLIAKNILKNLLNSHDPDVVDEMRFFRDEFKERLNL